MKKIAFMATALALVTTVSWAQSPLRIGVKGGANLSHMNSTPDNANISEKNRFAPGGYGGFLLEISGPAGSKFKGQIEALYNFHNYDNRYNLSAMGVNVADVKQTTTLHQISVPLMVKYFPIPSLSFNAGASVNFNLAAKETFDGSIVGVDVGTDRNIKDADYLNPVQIGALVGATYYIYNGFFVDGRFNYQFGSMVKQKNDNDPLYRTNDIQLGIGYKF